MPQATQSKPRQARVTQVFRDKCPYAVAIADGIPNSVTFSINPIHQVWEDRETPRAGTIVLLSDIRKNDKGWRAHKARFLRPEDESDLISNNLQKGP